MDDPFCSFGTRGLSLDTVVCTATSLDVAHTAASEDETACTPQPRLNTWLLYGRCLILDVYRHIFGRGCCTRTPTASDLWFLWLRLWTLLCVRSSTLTYHLDASLDGQLDGRLSLLWPM